ncbi:amidohydrolase family protein [Streptomyces sp. GMY02]|uniref:amidohydrolase family protein n=1 Tax=Streptomyces sp. GMY02 TaxID=1333528 RepID=UPI001F3BAA7B
MKIIALEERFADPAVSAAAAPAANALSPDFATAYAPALGLPYSPSAEALTDLAERRLADMDAGGVTMQVLSCLGAQQVPADVAPELIRAANDKSAAAVRAHPDRFAAFASLPTTAREAAVAELDRGVGGLGFVGTMIFGRTDGEFLDAPRFDPILAKAAALNVPIFLHPGVPPREVTQSDYLGGLSPVVATRLQTSAWGWHQETAVHFLHLVHSGVLDRYPDLQFILGHWGEMIPFYLERVEESPPAARHRTRALLRRVLPAERAHRPQRPLQPGPTALLPGHGRPRPHCLRGRLPLHRRRGRPALLRADRPPRGGQAQDRPRERRTPAVSVKPHP